jgi:hypothetical protein
VWRHDVPASLLHHWCRQAKRVAAGGRLKLVPVGVTPQVGPASIVADSIEIELAFGIRVDARVDEAALGRVPSGRRADGLTALGDRVWPASSATDCPAASTVWRCWCKEVLKGDPHCGHLSVFPRFRGKRGGLVKVLWHLACRDVRIDLLPQVDEA